MRSTESTKGQSQTKPSPPLTRLEGAVHFPGLCLVIPGLWLLLSLPGMSLTNLHDSEHLTQPLWPSAYVILWPSHPDPVSLEIALCTHLSYSVCLSVSWLFTYKSVSPSKLSQCYLPVTSPRLSGGSVKEWITYCISGNQISAHEPADGTPHLTLPFPLPSISLS